jgi:hypothetical protein
MGLEFSAESSAAFLSRWASLFSFGKLMVWVALLLRAGDCNAAAEAC